MHEINLEFLAPVNISPRILIGIFVYEFELSLTLLFYFIAFFFAFTQDKVSWPQSELLRNV